MKITEEIYFSLKEGDEIQTVMYAYVVLKQLIIDKERRCCMRRINTYKNDFDDVVCFPYEFAHNICNVSRVIGKSKWRIVFDKRNEEAQQILEKSRPNPEIQELLNKSKK